MVDCAEIFHGATWSLSIVVWYLILDYALAAIGGLRSKGDVFILPMNDEWTFKITMK